MGDINNGAGNVCLMFQSYKSQIEYTHALLVYHKYYDMIQYSII